MAEAAVIANTKSTGFIRGLGLLDSTMIVAGSMIGSGIFIVSADIARQVGAPGWLLVVWIVTGLLTLVAALSYGELAAMMPKAGGQYVYLREAFSPLWGFLYGWTLFLVIQTGTVAAVSVGFAKFLGVLWPKISVDNYIVAPIRITSGYAISLSTAQLIGVLMIVLLTFMNTRGLRLGKLVQNVFTITKTGSLIALILLGVLLGWNANAVHLNFGNLWHIGGKLQDVGRGLTAAVPFGLFVGICVAQTNSLFAADAWNNITFTAGEVKDPKRNIPLSLAFGTMLVIGLYLLANVAYLVTLPIETIKTVPADRVASATVDAIFPGRGAAIMAVAIMISTFGCNNGLILAGARAYYAMARDGLFFRKSGELNHKHVPACDFGGPDFLYPYDPGNLCASPEATRRESSIQGFRLSDCPRSLYYRRGGNHAGPVHLSTGTDVAGFVDCRNWDPGLFHLAQGRHADARGRIDLRSGRRSQGRILKQ